jgi:DNA-binding transcriptional MerR regulator
VSGDEETTGAGRSGKSASAFWTTTEVAEELDLPPHVLRFWESKFSQIKPLKRGGGRRYYRPEDVALLRRIRQWLYQEGYTIRGVQKLLRDGGLRGAVAAPEAAEASNGELLLPLDPAAASHAKPVSPPRPSPRAVLREIRRELLEIRALLERIKGG